MMIPEAKNKEKKNNNKVSKIKILQWLLANIRRRDFQVIQQSERIKVEGKRCVEMIALREGDAKKRGKILR